MTAPKYIKMPLEIPPEVLKDFVFTHKDGDTGQDAWHLLVHLVGRAIPIHPEKDREEAIVQIKNVYGEPALIFPDTDRKQVVLLLSHLSQHLTGQPQASAAIVKAVVQWRALKAAGSR